MLAGLSLLGLAAHPFTTYPLSLRLLRRVRPPALAAAVTGATPSLAICVCAYNEAAVIAAKLANLLALREAVGALEILVHVDASTDETAAILAGAGTAITLIVSERRVGKTQGMNRLAALATADVLVFTDANVGIAPAALAVLGRRFLDPRIGCVCGHLRYVNGADGSTAAVGSLYWRFEEALKQAESDTGSVIGADGALFAVRRSLHRPVPPDLIDDFYLSLSILCDGYRVIRDGGALAYEASVTRSGEEFRRKVRIACQAMNVHRALWPRLRSLGPLDLYKYISHKLLRWLVLFFLVPGLALTLLGLNLSLSWAFFFCLPLLIPPIRELFLAFLATSLGVLRSFRGDRFQTWTPASSIRPH